MSVQTSSYDLVVIGGGHAGIEAAMSAAKMGCKVALVTMTKNTIGLMPCNPSIGGPAKGQIVSEIDALGGVMGQVADQTLLQMKVLNRSRGPAVQCLRSQNDKIEYQKQMQALVESAANVTIVEGMATGIIFENDKVVGIIVNELQSINLGYYNRYISTI